MPKNQYFRPPAQSPLTCQKLQPIHDTIQAIVHLRAFVLSFYDDNSHVKEWLHTQPRLLIYVNFLKV